METKLEYIIILKTCWRTETAIECSFCMGRKDLILINNKWYLMIILKNLPVWVWQKKYYESMAHCMAPMNFYYVAFRNENNQIK